MAFSEVPLPVSRHKFFSYFATGTTSIAETLDVDAPFELKSVRVHLSTGHASAEHFNAYLVAAQTTAAGSVSIYDAILFSYAIQGSTDYRWHPSDTLIFNKGDTISFSMYMSAGNAFGLIVQGWTITA